MHYYFNKEWSFLQDSVLEVVTDFSEEGRVIGDSSRNTIKIFDCEGEMINVKSFGIPNAVNKVAYRFFRKSKARRSFEYGQKLLTRNINTPEPIAYAEETSAIVFTRSFYISEHLVYDLTFRELVHQTDYPDREDLLKAFTRFTFELHEKQVEFLDHSPGNTLIKLNNGDYKFYLVDLNRMNFRNLDFNSRMKNFSRLTPKKEMVKIMAKEYAELIGKPKEEVFEKMWLYTQNFQKKFRRKHMLKKKLKFWKE